MKRPQLIIFIFLMLISVSTAYGLDCTGFITGLPFDTDADDIINSNDFIPVNQADLDLTVKEFGAASYDFSGGHMTSSDFDIIGSGALSFWLNPRDIVNRQILIGKSDTGGAQNSIQVWVELNAGGTLRVILGDGTPAGDDFDSGLTPTINAWQHVGVNFDNTTITVYMNGSTASAGQGTIPVNLGENYTIGSYGGGVGLFFNGNIDDVLFSDRPLSAAEFAELRADSIENLCTVVPPAVPSGLTINASEIYNLSTILDFNVTISNLTYTNTTESNLTAGTAFFENITDGEYNITVVNQQHFNYADVITLSLENLTYQANLTQAELIIETYHLFTGNRILIFNSTFGTSTNATVNGTAFHYGIGGALGLSVISVGFYDFADTLTLINKSYNYYRANLTEYKLNITAQDSQGGSISSFSARIVRINNDYSQDDTDTTTTGTAEFKILNGTYNITVNSENYSTHNSLIQINESLKAFILNVSLLSSNTFNLSFYDTENRSIINFEQINFELFSDSSSGNFTTTNGTLLLSLLYPEAYTMRYYGVSTYPEHFYYFNLINRTFNNIKLYLHKSDMAQNISVQIVDEFNREVENAQVILERFYLIDNIYLTEQIAFTNFEGKVFFQAEQFNEYYRFRVFYEDVLRKTTNNLYLNEETYIISISLFDDVMSRYTTYEALSFSLSFLNASNTFRFTYADADATTTSACLKVTSQTDFMGETLYSTLCVNSASSTLDGIVVPVNGTTYTAYAYVNKSSIEYLMGTLQQSYDPTDVQDFGNDALWLDIILTIVLALFAAGFGVPFILLIMPLPTTILTVLNVLKFDLGIVLGLYAVFIILAYVVKK